MKLFKCKQILVMLSVWVMLLIAGCTVKMVVNPAFTQCTDNCDKTQIDCMTHAMNADEIRVCNSKLKECYRNCEWKYPRLIKRK